jgi:hypothetical protein
MGESPEKAGSGEKTTEELPGVPRNDRVPPTSDSKGGLDPKAEVGRKDDRMKLRYDLFPPESLRGIVKVLTYGAEKYGDENWKRLEHAESRYYAACMRHLEAWRSGEILDRESGIPHLAHAACGLVFLIWLERRDIV